MKEEAKEIDKLQVLQEKDVVDSEFWRYVME